MTLFVMTLLVMAVFGLPRALLRRIAVMQFRTGEQRLHIAGENIAHTCPMGSGGQGWRLRCSGDILIRRSSGFFFSSSALNVLPLAKQWIEGAFLSCPVL